MMQKYIFFFTITILLYTPLSKNNILSDFAIALQDLSITAQGTSNISPVFKKEEYQWFFKMMPEEFHVQLEQKLKEKPEWADIDTENINESMRAQLGFFLINQLMENYKKYFMFFYNPWNLNVIFISNLLQGKRKDKNEAKELGFDYFMSLVRNLSYHNLSEDYRKEIENTELPNAKQKLIGLYKIHLMPREHEILKMTKILIESIIKDTELQSLISDFKLVNSYLQESKDKLGNLLPLMVIYPSKGQENAQKLVNKLVLLFKDIQGSGNVPRYSTSVKEHKNLISYAQADADYKNNYLEKLDHYFDKSTNYALYRPDFLTITDYSQPYIPSANIKNPYLLQ